MLVSSAPDPDISPLPRLVVRPPRPSRPPAPVPVPAANFSTAEEVRSPISTPASPPPVVVGAGAAAVAAAGAAVVIDAGLTRGIGAWECHGAAPFILSCTAAWMCVEYPVLSRPAPFFME
jgi:hypothetical protein